MTHTSRPAKLRARAGEFHTKRAYIYFTARVKTLRTAVPRNARPDHFLVSGCAEGFLALRKDERRTKYVRRGGLGMTPFSWGAARGGNGTHRTPTLRNQGWGTRKIVSVERAEGRMEALRGSLRQAQGRQDRAALRKKQNTRPDHDTGATCAALKTAALRLNLEPHAGAQAHTWRTLLPILAQTAL